MLRIAANRIDERRHPWRVELHLQERRACRSRIQGVAAVRVAVRDTGALREGARVTERHAEPERDLILKGLRRRKLALRR